MIKIRTVISLRLLFSFQTACSLKFQMASPSELISFKSNETQVHRTYFFIMTGVPGSQNIVEQPQGHQKSISKLTR